MSVLLLFPVTAMQFFFFPNSAMYCALTRHLPRPLGQGDGTPGSGRRCSTCRTSGYVNSTNHAPRCIGAQPMGTILNQSNTTSAASDLSKMRPYFLAMAAAVPAIFLLLTGIAVSPLLMVLFCGMAVFGASFLLSWGCEAAEEDIPQAVAVAVIAIIAVLPEYAVDMYFTWMAGHHPDGEYVHYAIANMTGANRLLIGLGWSLLVIIFALRFHKGIELEADKRTDMAFLLLATLWAMVVCLKASLTLIDGAVFLALYAGYIIIVSRRPVEGGEAEGASAVLAEMPKAKRIRWLAVIFCFAGVVIALCAEPFSESLIASGKLLGIDEFILVQWIAPISSESPEFIIGIMFALRGNAALALGSLLSSKLNQWTLLVGTIPGAYALSSGGTSPIAFGPFQFSEIFLTAAQSFFALALLLDLKLGVREAVALLVLFLAQLLSPLYQDSLQDMLGLVRDPIRMHLFFAWIYVILGAVLCVRNHKKLRLLRLGFRVDAGQPTD